MGEILYPSDDEDSYMADPAFLERRFGARLLSEYVQSPEILGVARLVVMPSFSGESINTFIYRAHEVSIEILQAEHSLWYSLSGGKWIAPAVKSFTKPLDDLPAPLNRWESLKGVAKSSPTVEIAIIDGQEYATLDGVSYRHRIMDADSDLYAAWSNPSEMASNHVSQVLLVKAYEKALGIDAGKYDN